MKKGCDLPFDFNLDCRASLHTSDTASSSAGGQTSVKVKCPPGM